jgi:hypothetical protein
VNPINELTGEPRKYLREINRFALLDEPVPHTEIFRLDETPAFILATDALAGRALRAGYRYRILGPGKPARRQAGGPHRTAPGIIEGRIGLLD